MSTKTLSDYAFETKLALPYEAAVEKVTAALKEEGFGVLTSIDVKSTFKQKLDVDFRKYAILGACNPTLAHRSLSQEPAVGLLLPCNVIVYEEEGDPAHAQKVTVISIVDPVAMLEAANSPALAPVAQEAQARLRRVAAALTA
ncbi:MAG: DUF302 domain-containing protein [Caldilineaceae bacterium]|nr:DUF302 domain-containing protein [Caldilineaceae bacterium]